MRHPGGTAGKRLTQNRYRSLALGLWLGVVLAWLGTHHAAAEEPPSRVLFVGNSYFYYNDSVHNHVLRILRELRPALGADAQFKSATIGGARLDHHPIEWLVGTGNIGIDAPFEVVILQGGSFETLSEAGLQRFVATVGRFAAIIRESGGEPVLYMTPAYVPPHRRGGTNLTDTIFRGYTTAAAQSGARLIPVGLAFDASYRERPDFTLHQAFDGSHPNLRGTYLAACVTYLALYGGTLDGLNYDYFGALPADEARYLQRVATAAVAEAQRLERSSP